MTANFPAKPGNARPWIWLASTVGAAAGLASLAYSRRDRGQWHNAKRTMAQVADTARTEAKPWMGVVAAVAGGSVALAYRLSHKESKWQQARERAGRMAVRTGTQLRPWLSVAASTAI